MKSSSEQSDTSLSGKESIGNQSEATDSIQIFNPLEREDWDDIVAPFPQTSVFHSRAWLRVLHETYGYKPIALSHSSRSSPDALVLFMEVDSCLTGKRGVSLPFTDACSPLFHNSVALKPLYPIIQSLAQERAWRSFEIRFESPLFEKIAPSLSFFTHFLPLNPNTQFLFQNCSDSTRRATRKSEQSGLVLRDASTLEDLQAFYRLLGITRKRHGLPPQPWSFFQNIHTHLLAKEKGRLFLATHNNKPVAGALFLHHGKTAIYKFGASDERFQQLRPNNFVMWNGLKWHALKSFDSLHFGRTSLLNNGLRRFKLGWGARESTVSYYVQDTKTGKPLIVSDRSSGWHTFVFRHLPTRLSRLAGEFLYKHVG